MPIKILTVDDSKIFQKFIAKTLKPFACQITEASNGLEGIAAATRDKPDLIILDITMPVMDGVEALARLKSDPSLKGIPVIMLTGESDRESVLKTVKLGVRDYIVKPFKADQFLEKVAKIVTLVPVVTESRKKTFSDALTLLVVDDKPAIISMITDGLKGKAPWKVVGKPTGADAMAEVASAIPDAILMSVSLPNNEGETLLQQLRSNPRLHATPILGMCAQTDQDALGRAEKAGCSGIVTKPIDIDVLVGQLLKAMNIDASTMYFAVVDDAQLLTLPAKMTAKVMNDISGLAGKVFNDMVNAGLVKMIIDAAPVKEDDGSVSKLTLSIVQRAEEISIKVGVACSAPMMRDVRSSKETAAIPVGASVAEVQAAFRKEAAAKNPALRGMGR